MAQHPQREEAAGKALDQFAKDGCDECGSKRPKESGFPPAEYLKTGKDVYVKCRDCGHMNLMSSKDLG